MQQAFRECPGGTECSGAHVRFTAEQARMVAECRARAERQRREAAERRERFRETGVWK